MTKLEYIELISIKRNIKPKSSKFHYLFSFNVRELEQIYLYDLPILNWKVKWKKKKIHKKEKYNDLEISVFERFKLHLIDTKQVSEELNLDSSVWYPKFKIWEIDRLSLAEQDKKDLERLEIYEKFTIPNLRKLILKLYNNEELTREENEIIFEIMSLKNKEIENERKEFKN